MDSLPSSPPHTTPTLKQNRLSPFKTTRNQLSLTPDSLLYTTKIRSKEQPILRHPRKTNPIVWCAAIICMIFSLLVIFFGITTLIVYLAIQPKSPVFDAPAASLSPIYFNPPRSIDGEITFIANFSNPNRKLNVRFEYLYIELYFSESLAATQLLQPFSQRPGEARLVSVHLQSSLVYPPPSLVMELQEQQQRNRIVYKIRGTSRVRVETGLLHYSYWLHAECQLDMTSPPNGVLITRNCRTKR